jgi:hypothetical protein
VWGGGGEARESCGCGLGCSGLVSVGAPPGVAEAPVSPGGGRGEGVH